MKSYIVVGAGILGASTAYHLAKTGVKVTIIDRDDSGQATAAAAGIICPWLTRRRNKSWYNLVKRGATYYPSLVNELKSLGEKDTGYAQVGAIRLHENEEKLNQVLAIANKRKETAPEMGEISKLSPMEARELFPPLSLSYGAIHIGGAARVNGQLLCQSLIRAAKGYGATYISGNASLIEEGQVVKGVQTTEGKFYSDKVIVTAGAWAKEILAPLHLNFNLRPQKAQIVHVDLRGAVTDKWPVVIPPGNHYLLSFKDGRIVAGATHEDHAGFDYRVTAGGVQEVIEKMLETAPGLTESTFIETRVGFRPITPDSIPVMGEWPPYSGLLIANGLGASGLTAGPYLGQQLAMLALGEQMELDLADYSLSKAIDVME
ncbi:NAD(P)/FAD-dependent oxidoreductase [Salipaludibacillus daqingensis]|uniref:NAD(P)/FAD-dependent oxidoreductase n=1 Tax=Salipaludibacillus daqingensis TaxID=3041001 RepID=UPI00247407A5|nr:FAD-binding oxidoreductase [Salipaludibacillus daqingensis]